MSHDILKSLSYIAKNNQLELQFHVFYDYQSIWALANLTSENKEASILLNDEGILDVLYSLINREDIYEEFLERALYLISNMANYLSFEFFSSILNKLDALVNYKSEIVVSSALWTFLNLLRNARK